MAEAMTTVYLGDSKSPVSTVSPISVDEKADYHVVEHEEPQSAATEESKQHEPLLGSKQPQSPIPNDKTLSSAGSTPLKEDFPNDQADEEKVSHTLNSLYLCSGKIYELLLHISRPNKSISNPKKSRRRLSSTRSASLT